jgi:hypothetical protein
MLKERKCGARDCRKPFMPKIKTQLYCTTTCKNRAASQRRAKEIDTLRKAVSTVGASL